MERFGENFLEERKLVKRWKGPIPAIVNLLFTLVIFYATWWIFQDPRGLMRSSARAGSQAIPARQTAAAR